MGILGGGPGGYICALRAAQLGLSVVLVEGDEVGGTCLNRGCIPTKALVKSAEVWREIKGANELGIQVENPVLDFAQVMRRKEQVVTNIVKGVEQLLQGAKVRVVKGWGKVEEVGKIEVMSEAGTEEFTVDDLVLATGSLPAFLPIPGVDLPGVVTSDELLEEHELPASLVVIGGGVIGMEFACIYQTFGCHVTVVEMMPAILPNVDEEIPKRLNPVLKKSGMEIMVKTAVKEIRREGDHLIVLVEDGKGSKEITAERILVATGRQANLRGIDVEKLGLVTERGRITVNRKLETNLPHVYAIGDVHGGMMLAHTASAEGMVAAERIKGEAVEMDYRAVPGAIFTYPEIATVGKTEQELKAEGKVYKVSKFPFSAIGKAVAIGETYGIVKIVADETGVILGAAILGPQASSLIQELVMAVERGMSGDEVARIIHAHPTLPEAVMEAAHGVMGKALHIK